MSLPSMQSIFSKSRRNIKVNIHSNLTSLSFAICHLTINLKTNTIVFRYILYLFVREHIFLVKRYIFFREGIDISIMTFIARCYSLNHSYKK